jgi:hypothetical protein
VNANTLDDYLNRVESLRKKGARRAARLRSQWHPPLCDAPAVWLLAARARARGWLRAASPACPAG